MFKKVKKKGKIITPIAIQGEEENKNENKESLKDKSDSTIDIEEIRNTIKMNNNIDHSMDGLNPGDLAD